MGLGLLSRALILAVVPQSVPALVFGADDRLTVSSQAGSVFGPIGVLFGGAVKGHATAFLVDACHVLTVRHAFGAAGPVVGLHATFAAGVSGESRNWTLAEARVVEAGDATSTDVSASGDWALLRLSNCLGKRFGTALLSNRKLLRGHPIQLAGYPSDRNFAAGLILDPDCQVRSIGQDGSIGHDCATQPGNSGSPLFDVVEVRGKKRLLVHGMNYAGHSYGVPGANLQSPVTSFHSTYAARALPISQVSESSTLVSSRSPVVRRLAPL